MSILQKLTEGIVNRDLAKEGEALLRKWTQTGLLEGLPNEHARHNMARLLENQAKELLRESSSMSAGDVEGFAAVAFPIVRRVFAGLIANDLVSVQPMSLPSGLIFFLDFDYSARLGDLNTQASRLGNLPTKSIYGGDRLASQITGGVNLVGNLQEDLSGPRTTVGYAYSSPTGSNAAILGAANAAEVCNRATFKLDGNVSETNQRLIEFDPDLLSQTDLAIIVMDIVSSAFTSADYENMGAWEQSELVTGTADATTPLLTSLNASTNITAVSAIGNLKMIRRLTKKIAGGSAAGSNFQSSLTSQAECVRIFIVCDQPSAITESNTSVTLQTGIGLGTLQWPQKDSFATGDAPIGAIASYTYPLEDNDEIPEIDIKVDSVAITAQTKKLKARWTPELGQDLSAYHNLDAEVELTSILSEQIALEIDREILADLIRGATASTYYWSRSPGLFVNKVTGAELGATSAAPDFTGTVSEWYETLIETMNDVSAQIHRKTLRGGANFVVVGPEVANILEFTSGFRANVSADADKGDIGAVKVGSLNRKWDVIVDPYFPRQVVLIGRRGNSFLESGYVYAPYVPLQTTPTIFGPEDFVPRKGVMTRYAKKMVRPDMYGLVVIRGLLGESGAS